MLAKVCWTGAKYQQPRFALFAKPTAATAGLTDKFSTVLDAELRSPFHEDGVWLVRPDGYVACAAGGRQ